MAGTIEGGRKTAAKNLAKNPNFYAELALKAQKKWAENGRKPRGFSAMPPEKVSAAGRKGGLKSRRNKSV